MSRVEHLAEGVVLHLGDCRDVLPTLGKVDAVVTDPPYGVTQNAWDEVIPFPDWWRLLEAVCSGAIVLTARQPFAAAAVSSRPERFRHEWIWEKNKASGHLNANRAPLLAHETVLVFAEAAPIYNPILTDGHGAGHAARRRTASPNYGAQRPTDYGGSTKRYPRSVQQFPIINNDDPDKLHPTQKPLGLVEYFIRTYSDAGATILDPCMGSGTTGAAAVNTGRRFIGIEKYPAFFDIACRRISEALKQPDMFVERPAPPKQEAFGL